MYLWSRIYSRFYCNAVCEIKGSLSGEVLVKEIVMLSFDMLLYLCWFPQEGFKYEAFVRNFDRVETNMKHHFGKE